MAGGAAFVTGGSSGIGLELARGLAARGHDLVLIARGADRLAAARAAIEAEHTGVKVLCLTADVSDRIAIEAAVAQGINAFGPPAWAICNAGMVEPGLFLDQDAQVCADHMAVNYLGALYFAKAAARAMTGAGHGRLVLVSSGAAFFGVHGYSAYGPSKFALRGLAETLRVELKPHGVSVTLAYPPDTDTPMLEAENRLKSPAMRAITESGGVWPAAKVAGVILRRAEAGRFAAAPGVQMTALLALHSVLAPVLRSWQGGIIRKRGF